MEAGRFAAGSGRAELPHRGNAMGFSRKLDPFSLPVRFTAPDEAADERLRVVDLHRERVVLRRSVRGVRMALNLPVAAFRGVAIRMVFADAETAPTSIAVVLEHGDPALSLPLFSAYTLAPRMVCWDEKWFYIEQTCSQRDGLAAVGWIKGVLRDASGIVDPQRVINSVAPGIVSPPMPEAIAQWNELTREKLQANDS